MTLQLAMLISLGVNQVPPGESRAFDLHGKALVVLASPEVSGEGAYRVFGTVVSRSGKERCRLELEVDARGCVVRAKGCGLFGQAPQCAGI